MRTIKFRGKHLCGQWYFGNLIIREVDSPVQETKQAYRCVCIGDIENGSEEEVEENTIGQFTGLHDKNGVEIYEGDILKNNISNIPFGVVTWHYDGYFFIDIEFGKYPIRTNFRPLGEMLNIKLGYGNVKDVTFEVIGNIHDNPDYTGASFL